MGTALRGAIKNGVTRDELRAIIHVIAIYCSVPQAMECFRSARKVLTSRVADIVRLSVPASPERGAGPVADLLSRSPCEQNWTYSTIWVIFFCLNYSKYRIDV